MSKLWYTLVAILVLAMVVDVIYILHGLHEYYIFGDNPYAWTTCIWESTKVLLIGGIFAWMIGSALMGALAAAAAAAAAEAAKAVYEGIKELVVEIKNYIVDLFTVKDVVRQRCPNALRAEILKKKANAVDVGIFGNDNRMSEKITINADMGVADDIYVGETISITA